MIYLNNLKSYCLAVCCRAHRIKEWESSQISNFTEKDMVSAMRKLEDAAFKWDHTNYIESMYVKGFEVYLTPYDFKQQIERSFKIRLTGAEVLFARYYLELCVTGSPFAIHSLLLHVLRSALCCRSSRRTRASTAWTATLSSSASASCAIKRGKNT